MKGRLIDMTVGLNGKQRITVEVDEDFREEFDRLHGKELDVEIDQYREKRSKNANAYFHVLLNKIARKAKMSEDAAKIWLVCQYGTLARNTDGSAVGIKLPEKTDVTEIYPYAVPFDTREEDGVKFICYKLYKRTRSMNTAEMADLIDGAIYEAKELGIVTDTPEQLANRAAPDLLRLPP